MLKKSNGVVVQKSHFLPFWSASLLPSSILLASEASVSAQLANIVFPKFTIALRNAILSVGTGAGGGRRGGEETPNCIKPLLYIWQLWYTTVDAVVSMLVRPSLLDHLGDGERSYGDGRFAKAIE